MMCVPDGKGKVAHYTRSPRHALPIFGDNMRFPESGFPPMEHYLLLVVSAVFVNNVVLVRVLGLCPFMGVSSKLDSALGMGFATSFVLTLAAGASHLIDRWLLQPFDLTYLRTLAFVLVIAALVQFVERVLEKTSPVLHRVLGIYLPLITTNCAVLGVPLISVNAGHGFVQSLLFGFASSLGFTLVLVLFGALREHLEAADIPAPFRGAAIALISAGFISLAFMGFAGLDR